VDQEIRGAIQAQRRAGVLDASVDGTGLGRLRDGRSGWRAADVEDKVIADLTLRRSSTSFQNVERRSHRFFQDTDFASAHLNR